MNKLIAFFALCLVLAPARAAAPLFDDNSASQWMTYYYVEKNTKPVGAFLHWVAGTDFVKKRNTGTPVSGFLAALFADNPGAVRDWISDIAPNDGAKQVIERALWLSGHKNLIGEVYHDTPDYLGSTPPALNNLALDTPGMWDVMWSAFSATGDTAYPARLIDLLDPAKPLNSDPKLNALYHKIVAWSVEANAGQHELIRRLLEREAKVRQDATKAELEGMLKKIDAKRMVTQNCDGQFCGLLALVSEANLAELEKPFDQGPILKELPTAKAGDHVAIVLCFSGLGLAEDLTGNVTFDLHTLKPDGTLYGGEHKDLEALKRKVPMRYSIYDNHPMLVMLRFEPQDPKGEYRVEVTLKDRIAGKTVRLKKSITLIN